MQMRRRAAEFWNGLMRDAAGCDGTPGATDALLVAAEKHLARYNEHLGCELICTNSVPALVITAYGNSDHRDAVVELCSAAPISVPFEVKAFRPAAGANAICEIDDRCFDVAAMRFQSLSDANDPMFLGICVHIYAEKPLTDELAFAAATLAVQMILGEETFMTRVDFIKAVTHGRSVDTAGFVPMIMLPTLVERHLARVRALT